MSERASSRTVGWSRPALGLVLLLALAACARPAPRGGGVPVTASFDTLAEFARRVGGNRIDVTTLVPPGAEPHDYEPSPQQLARVSRTRLLIYNGAGFEPWVDRLRRDLPDDAVVVETTAGLPLLRATPHEDPHAGAPAGGRGAAGERGPAQAVDPHVWLDPVLAQRQVAAILRGLQAVDPAGADLYARNATRFQAELEALHRRYAATLRDCRRRTFITTHGAFAYLARRYGLRMIAITGLSPEAEPSPARLRELVREARRHGVRVVYTETLLSPRLAETLAREVGARTRVLNPLEGLTPEERRAGRTYLTVMAENLQHLAEGLACR
ncbi:MAG: zinc ABC transporter substrate-binding protein [Armatimonadota bacterium]|nr:zinc ABC transporter substrate-binding protein [Armatimonadota bacterium]MDR7460242.1 zinc ABC transporter substrate-binding protein [Armatimonadota bacterium]MDR7478962.1 zinc ABC transporter substrate-binding protein [Armatimonadota bacterium]MDR7490000.1 zinc ABC transporter substrate-binding protein [Armatimonadota bacterium]MDR7526342.1 zinc ABC transporter substrate-binding protein [Armatimonadota bacterium]